MSKVIYCFCNETDCHYDHIWESDNETVPKHEYKGGNVKLLSEEEYNEFITKYNKLLEFVKEQYSKRNSQFHHICNCDEIISSEAGDILKEIGELND